MKRQIAGLPLLIALIGCSASKPILYPNTHLNSVGQAQADNDIAECKQMANQAGAGAGTGKAGAVAGRTAKGGAVGAITGAVGGAIAESAGRGAVIGAASGATAGFAHSLFGSSKPNPTYMNFVNRCLSERGYDPIGWN